MKYAVLALLGLTTVNATAAKRPDNIGGRCGTVLEKDECTGKDVEKTMICDFDEVCSSVDLGGYTGASKTKSFAEANGAKTFIRRFKLDKLGVKWDF